MRICYYLADQNPHRDRTLGITAYTSGLLNALARPGLDFLTVTSKSSFKPDERSVRSIVLPFRTDSAPGRLLADQLHPFFTKPRADLWHYPKGYLPLFCRTSSPVVGTVHDLILQHYADHYPETRSRLEFSYWLAQTRRSIPRFDAILADSSFTAGAIHQFCERFHLKSPPVSVTYLGCRYESVPQPEVPLKEEYVLHFASQLPHKRTLTLLQFWSMLQRGESTFPELRLIGRLPATAQEIAEKLHRVVVMNRIPTEDMQVQIERALAVIVPSEIEGFGLPVLEAYYLGTPVLYVQGTCTEELVGQGTPGGFFLDSFDSFTTALEQVLGLPASAIASKGRELRKRFAWSDCAEKTLREYRRLCPASG